MPEIDQERAQKLRKKWVRLTPDKGVPPYFRKLMIIGVSIAVIAALATVLLIMSKMPEQNTDIISKRDAYMNAYKDAGTVKKETTFEIVKLEEDMDPMMYRVYFYDKEYYFKYLINAETGGIAKKKVLDGGHARYSESEGTTDEIDFSHDFD